jgi:hypothetical protein
VGFLVEARFRLWPWKADWAEVEAVGTWFGAITSAAILAVLAIRSERFTRGLEASRQARDDEEAQRREQFEADRVICNAWPADQRNEDGTRVAGAVVVTVINGAGSLLSDVWCVAPGGIGSVHLSNALAPKGEIGPMTLPAKEPIRLSADDHEVRGSVSFTFLLNRQWWSRCPVDLQAVRMPRRLP